MVAAQSPTTRRFERVPTRIPVSLIKEAEGRIVQRDGNTVDVSIRGLRVLTDLPLEPGETLGVFIPEGLLGRFRVVWALPWRSEAGLEIDR
ncbi:MAG: PilZ domain-containing protein [Acidobacteria bacterium]|nr:PilZ domain-containing protein [Acidobacteriota bacterium]MBI1984220.1 PilZ domain-containing protein [Acidobacteriota bacterium]